MKELTVVAGILIKDNKILCTQRKDKGELALKWEFPGGKVEDGETNQHALYRELKEELEIDSVIGDYLMTVEHEYSTFQLKMHCYYVDSFTGDFVLNEHADMKWLDKEELDSLDWAEADIPIIEKLRLLKGDKDV